MIAQPAETSRRFATALKVSLAVGATILVLEVGCWVAASRAPQPTRTEIGTVPMIEADESTIWRFKPLTPFAYEADGHVIRSATNAQGAHDEEWTPQRLAQPRRVLALGDSFTFGWGVDLGDVWWKQLARIRGDGGAPLEVFGAGYWFSTYDQHYLFLKRFFPIVRPSLVVYGLFPPHVLTELTRVPHYDERGDLVRVNDPIIGIRDGTLHYSVDGGNAFTPMAFPYLLSYPRHLYEAYRFEQEYRQIIDMRLRDKVSYDDPLLPSREEILRPGYERLFESLELMDAYVRANGAQLLVVLIPAVGQVVAGRLEESVAQHAHEVLTSRYPQEKILAFCEQHGISGLDPLASFRSRPDKERLYLATDVHLSPAGHEALARAVDERLTDSRLAGR